MAALYSAFELSNNVENPDLSDVKAFLVTQITKLLDRNPSRLMSILYRIDVLEKHVKNAFETAPPGHLAAILADLVIQRQLEKQKYRKGMY